MKLRHTRSLKTLCIGLFIFIAILLVVLHFHHRNPSVVLPKPRATVVKSVPITKPVSITKPVATKTNVSKKTHMPWEKHSLSWRRVRVARGDSLSKIFSRFQLGYLQVKALLALPDAKQHFGHLYVGQTFYLHINRSKKTFMVKYPINNDVTFYVYPDGNVLKTQLVKKPLTTALIYRAGVVKRSLSTALHHAGLPYHVASEFSSIFAGTINFEHDLHSGDQFRILYKEYYLNGKKDHPGPIVAASFTNKGKEHIAIRFTYPHNHTGYYTPKGRGVEPLFLRAPLKYKRISGHFTFHRYDPVLHIVHPHLGIDYAARYGTPIKSIGDGKVIFRGRKGGYGNAVLIRYNRKYRALYGHMSHIARHLRMNQSVKKGQVIGFVGSSGWSTGPHLHFEMYVYGIPRDPLKMKFVGGKSIPKSYLKPFYQQAKQLLAALSQNHPTE